MAMMIDIASIQGESTSTNPDWTNKIQIDTMGYDISQRTTQSVGTGLASGGATVGHMTISKAMDRSTPFLFYQLCAGDPIPKVTIRVTRSGAKDQTYGGLYEAETYEMTNVIVSSYHTSGALSPGGLPYESWSFSFVAISERYQELDQTGNKKGNQPAGFDFGRGVTV